MISVTRNLTLHRSTLYSKDDQDYLHSEDGLPALMMWDPDCGTLRLKVWYRHGDVYREGGPAHVAYFPDGKVEDAIWYDDEGNPSREDGPYRIRVRECGGLKLYYNGNRPYTENQGRYADLPPEVFL